MHVLLWKREVSTRGFEYRKNAQNPVFLEKVIQFFICLLTYTRLSDTLCQERYWQGLSFFPNYFAWFAFYRPI